MVETKEQEKTARWLRIGNLGKIEEGALTILGASTKRDDPEKIGYFGSGLKYAAAVLMRNGIPFRLFSGEKEIEFGTVPKAFRGRTFDVMTIDGKETGFSTDMGPDWKPWYAIREIYCNALDEDCPVCGIADEPRPAKDATRFYIPLDHPELADVLNNWSKYFSGERRDVAMSADGCKVFHPLEEGITRAYRKGVLCYEGQTNRALFDYDMDWFEINESRELKGGRGMELDFRMAKWLAANANVEVARILLEGLTDKTFESRFDWQYCDRFGDAWLEAIGGRTLVPQERAGWYFEADKDLLNPLKSVTVPSRLLKSLVKYFGDKVSAPRQMDSGYVVLNPDARQADMLARAVEFVQTMYPDFATPIEVCDFQRPETLGSALGRRIQVSRKAFDLGLRKVVLVLLEESFHIYSDAGDETRAFQDYLLNQLVSLVEKERGIYI
ncbi:MAG: hypothetical protein JRN42_05890 [Nitrososphaerota archaeon]|nr:hypothetical protein [Nitrososphaerota archaeon]